jgi:hypothetical protein
MNKRSLAKLYREMAKAHDWYFFLKSLDKPNDASLVKADKALTALETQVEAGEKELGCRLCPVCRNWVSLASRCEVCG